MKNDVCETTAHMTNAFSTLCLDWYVNGGGFIAPSDEVYSQFEDSKDRYRDEMCAFSQKLEADMSALMNRAFLMKLDEML